MDNSKIIKYKTLYPKEPYNWNVLDDYIKIRDNGIAGTWINCNHDEQTFKEVFNGASLSNLRENNTGHKPVKSGYSYNRLIDIELSNRIDPSTISFDVDDEYHIWRDSKKLKFCHMFSEKLVGENIEEFPPLTDKMLNKDKYGVYASKEGLKLSIDKTERTLFGKIKCNIVVTDYDCHLGCNKAGLPECVKVLSDKIAGIPVNKGRLLEIDDGETFRFFADKNARYDGVEIDTDKPITCRYQDGNIKVVHFVDKQGKEHKPQESKENEEKTKQEQKKTARKTINDIINMLPLYKNSQYKQEDIATQDYTWLNNLSEAIKNENTSFTMEDLMQINNYTGEIARNFNELLDEKQPLAQQRVSYLKKNIANNLNNLKKMFEEKNICKTKLEEPKPVVHNDNNNNNNNTQIIQESNTIKNINDKNLKTLYPSIIGNLKQTIEDYVNNKQGASNQQVVANAIRSLINKDEANFLEKYSRIFAFSQKDKRAQQVYETYKDIEKNQNIILNDDDDTPKPQYKMYALGNVHSINTPCGGCF